MNPPQIIEAKSNLTLMLSALMISLAVAKWSRLPGIDKVPVNMSLASAKAEVREVHGISDSDNFIQGDPLRPIKISAGKSDAVIKFIKQSVVNRASFVSDGLEGKVEASISADGKAWNSLVSVVFSPSDRLVNLATGAAQGRYLRLQFEIVRGGSIRGFQVFGSDSASDYTFKQNADNSGTMVNLASGIGGGRLIYISPETLAARNEALKGGSINFPESNEKYRTVVYDLGQVRSLEEFGSTHSARPVRLLVYTFEVLPEKEDWRGRLSFDSTVFDTMEPTAKAEDANGEGVIKIKTKSVVKTRYVALRWEPDFNPPAFTVSGIQIGASGILGGGPAGAGGGAGGGGTDSQGGQGGGGTAAAFTSPFQMSGGYSGAPSAGGAGPTGPLSDKGQK